MHRRLAAAAIAVVTSIAAGTTVATAAYADTIPHSAVVSANPVDWTPHVHDGYVRAITVVGGKVIAAGDFTQVRRAGTGTRLTRANIMAFDMNTGVIDAAFAPRFEGGVLALAPGANGTVYAGGSFTAVNGVARRGLVRLRVADGSIDPAFTAKLSWGSVRSMARRGDHLYVGGHFVKVANANRTGVARLDAATGAADPDFDIAISDPRAGSLRVQALAVDPADARLVINGTFTKVEGAARHQIAVIDLGATPALSSWATDEYSDACGSSFDTYMRKMDFAPDGSYFVVVTTGGPRGTTTLCDSAARWEAGRTGAGQRPTWVNYTGGDTLLSVTVTGAAVYVGGHQRWMDNPQGRDSAGPGAVTRTGIAAIHPVTGLSKDIPWNPTRTRGVGVEALTAVPEGLFVGSDTEQLGGEYHARLGMFPLG
jgi:Domain of unknown function (DUF5122) beta-propeller